MRCGDDRKGRRRFDGRMRGNMNLTIGEIAKACRGRLMLREGAGITEGTRVDSVTLDSRRVTPGGVFIATVGERRDGHEFIAQVFAQGAVLAVVEKTPGQVEDQWNVPADAWGSYVLTDDSLEALKEIGAYYRSRLTIPVVGITGSVGKTSTKEFIAGALSAKYNVLKTEGNHNNELGVPLTLLSIREEHEAAVIEMGISDFGEMRRLSRMAKPDICVITNIGQCHLENLKSREGILKAKTEIFEYMSENGEVCLNGGDDMLRTVTQIRGKRTHFFGLGEDDCEEVYATDIVGRGLFGSSAAMHIRKKESPEEIAFPLEIPLPGRHMVVNAAAAACVADLLGLDAEQIARGIAGVRPVDGRNRLLRMKDYTVIDDCYNANPVSMRSAIDLLSLAEGYRVAILGDMFELGEGSGQMHAGVGAYAVQSGADCIFCVGENSRHMYEGAVNAAEERGRDASEKESSGGPKIYYFGTRTELLHALKEQREALLPVGCTVLVKASHGMKFEEVTEYLSGV